MSDLLLHVTSAKLPDAAGLCVAVQTGRDEHIGVTDASAGTLDIDVPLSFDGDWRGPFVQGKKGERFVYLVWGPRTETGLVGQAGRTKLMLSGAVPAAEEAVAKGRDGLVAELDLVDAKGKPRLARLKEDFVSWRTA